MSTKTSPASDREDDLVDTEGSFLHFDKNNLDMEWEKQPRLYYQFALLLADARKEHAEAKAELDVVTAELADAIRKDPWKYMSLEKATVDAVKEAVLMQDDHKIATRALISSKHKVDIHEAAVWALDHRKKALENEVQLFLSNYFSRPKMKGGESLETMKETRKKERVVNNQEKKKHGNGKHDRENPGD